MNLDYYLYNLSYLISLFNGYPVIIRITAVMVALFAFISIWGLFRLIVEGCRLDSHERRKYKVSQRYSEKLAFILSNDNDYSVEEVNSLLLSKREKVKSWEYEQLTDLIVSTKQYLEKQGGYNQNNFRNSLECFGLMRFWEQKVRKSGRWLRKVALVKMASLNNGLHDGLLAKSFFHKDKQLRKTAKNIHLDQDNYHPFRFMEENFDESFDQLDKLRLHVTLVKRSKTGKLPNLLYWINNSNNIHYVSFVIREIGFFKQMETAASLVELLDGNEFKTIRIQIIQTLCELGYTAIIPNLMRRYELESSSICRAIIEAFGKLQSTDSFQFLVDRYSATADNGLKLYIVRALMKYGEQGVEKLKKIRRQESEDKRMILDQVFAENLMYSNSFKK